MAVKQRIEFRGRMYAKIKGWPAAVKTGLGGAIVDPWWKEYLPLHFTKQAYFRYTGGAKDGGPGGIFKPRYRKRTREEYLEDVRTGRSQGRLFRRVLRDPMHASGNLEFSVLGIQPRIAGSARSGVRGYLRGSNVANFHTGNNPQTGGYNMVAELRVVNEQEATAMGMRLEEVLVAFLNEKGAVEIKEV
ncbi:MAG: hypothetical protein KIS92_04490 [Planctomycetota bacterium]|nr:hypothetical protein [Planctomycetota bacterium]